MAVLCGLLLWKAPFGDAWVNASYDYLFRFGAHAVTNKVTLILMDNEAYDHFHQTREQPWDRELHAQLLNKLADDGCDRREHDGGDQTVHRPGRRRHPPVVVGDRRENVLGQITLSVTKV